MMSVDETLMCSFQILKPAEKKIVNNNTKNGAQRPITPSKSGSKDID